MQFSVVALLATFAAFAYAVPTGVQSISQGCDAVSCAVALGPTAVGCVSAAAQAGLDPVSDAGCFASGGLKVLKNPPAACNGCGSDIENAVTKGATSVIGSVGSALKSIL